jgi:ribosome-associated translation inhibitor RaiA
VKNLNQQVLLEEAREEMRKIAPRHSEIEVDVQENKHGVFSTHIRLITKQKIYFAKKDDLFLYKSFHKAVRAIKAQVRKNKVGHHAVKYSLAA